MKNNEWCADPLLDAGQYWMVVTPLVFYNFASMQEERGREERDTERAEGRKEGEKG
jgi:hypothetical protein